MIDTADLNGPALILLVDESKEMRTQLKQYLSADGYRFAEGADGKEALSLCKLHHPDLVVLDIAMPAVDGIDVCTRLHLLPEGKHVPVLMLTSMDDRQSLENVFRTGADEYIKKPVHQDVLRHRIKSLLEVSRSQSRLAVIEALQTLNNIIEACTGTLHLDEILHIVLDRALEISGLHGGTICLLGEDNTLHLVAQRNASQETIEDLTTHEIKVGDCLCGNCAQDMTPLILWTREDVLQYSSREVQRGEDIRFHASFAFVYKGKCVGVLCVFTRTDYKPDKKLLKLIENMACQVALAIENARLYEMTVRNAYTLEKTVEKRTKELEAANASLKELDRLKSMFIASMSHELRTPLNSIIGFTGMTLQGLSGELNAEQRDNLERVYKSARHLLELISDVIDISKIEAGRIDIFMEEFSLDELLREAVETVRPQIKEKGLTLETGMLLSIRMHTDRKRLLQCILNILSNAVKYTEKGTIIISTRDAGKDVEIDVSDTGIGISEEEIPRLFKAFERIQSHLHIKAGGTGLGLYLTKKIASDLLGGTVEVETEKDRGSTFRLRIKKDVSSSKTAPSAGDDA